MKLGLRRLWKKLCFASSTRVHTNGRLRKQWVRAVRAASHTVVNALRVVGSAFSAILPLRIPRKTLRVDSDVCFRHVHCPLRLVYANGRKIELYCDQHDVTLGNKVSR